jgi:hypothetical protein
MRRVLFVLDRLKVKASERKNLLFIQLDGLPAEIWDFS